MSGREEIEGDTVKEKLEKLIADFEARKLWGSIELTYRAGTLEVINRSETIKEQPHAYSNRNSR
jgi:hypothetical protein